MSRLIAGCLAALMLALPAAAETTGSLGLELNNAADTETGACRLTFVAANGLPTGLEALSWQVAVFDAQGVVQSLLVLDFGALAAGKTRIVLFDLPGRPCADISRVVINDVAECRPADGAAAPPDCLAALTASTRTPIAFGV